jgi:hypothetical protein
LKDCEDAPRKKRGRKRKDASDYLLTTEDSLPEKSTLSQDDDFKHTISRRRTSYTTKLSPQSTSDIFDEANHDEFSPLSTKEDDSDYEQKDDKKYFTKHDLTTRPSSKRQRTTSPHSKRAKFHDTISMNIQSVGSNTKYISSPQADTEDAQASNWDSLDLDAPSKLFVRLPDFDPLDMEERITDKNNLKTYETTTPDSLPLFSSNSMDQYSLMIKQLHQTVQEKNREIKRLKEENSNLEAKIAQKEQSTQQVDQTTFNSIAFSYVR